MNCIQLFSKTAAIVLLAAAVAGTTGCRTSRNVQTQTKLVSADSIKRNDSVRQISSDLLIRDFENWEIVRTEFFPDAADSNANDTTPRIPEQKTQGVKQVTHIRGLRQRVSAQKETQRQDVSQVLHVKQQSQLTETKESLKKTSGGQFVLYAIGLGALLFAAAVIKKKLF